MFIPLTNVWLFLEIKVLFVVVVAERTLLRYTFIIIIINKMQSNPKAQERKKLPRNDGVLLLPPAGKRKLCEKVSKL